MKHEYAADASANAKPREEQSRLSIRNGMQAIFLLCLMSFVANSAYASQGANGIHDPSSVIKRDGVYHIWGTGNGIHHITSTDLVGWTAAPTVFPAGQYPSWINTYVPGFTGTVWAPEVFFLDGKYYLYYSCSTFGSKVSAIGLATSTDLNTWTDQGMVVFSNNSTPYNAIDPAVFQDANGTPWLVFGSYWTGIWMGQLDSATGKLLGATLTNVANVSDAEAGFVIRRGNFYYLFYNRGSCCNGTSSTYYMQVARSANPNGPYVDRTGAPLFNNTGTTFLSTSGRHIGPGHVGHFVENGVEYLSHHFYDGTRNGAPTLRLSNLRWDGGDGFPRASADWVANGRYKIINEGNSLVWENAGCTGNSLEAIAQGTYTGNLCEQWDFTSIGNGAYKITSAQSGLAANLLNCSADAGAKLNLFGYTGAGCQQFNIERAGNGGYVISSVNGNYVVDVPFGSIAVGTQLQTWFYNGFTAQKWLISPSAPILLTEGNSSKAVAVDSVTLMRDPLPFRTSYNFSSDERTRITFFAAGLELLAGENASIITAQAEDSQRNVYPLTIEHVGQVPNFSWLSQVTLRLPDGIEGKGDISLSVSLRGATSNKASVTIR